MLLDTVPDLNFNWRDLKERSPLTYAAEARHFTVVELLLNRVPSLFSNSYDLGGRTSLFGAVYNGHHEVVELLLNAKGIDLAAIGGVDELLRNACSHGHEDVVKVLLDYEKVDLESRDVSQFSAIRDLPENPIASAAILSENERITKLLIDHTSEIGFKNGFNRKLILQAHFENEWSIVEFILDHCSDFDLQDEIGRTLLSYAAEDGYFYLGALVLKKGFNPTIPDFLGRTLLSYAAEGGSFSALKLLARCKPEEMKRADIKGLCPLDYARQKGHEQIADFMQRRYDSQVAEHSTTIDS